MGDVPLMKRTAVCPQRQGWKWIAHRAADLKIVNGWWFDV